MKKAIIRAVLLSAVLINLSFSYTVKTGEPLLQNEGIFYTISSSKEPDRISLSFGAGLPISKPEFIISPNVGLKISKYVNVLTGFDFYTNSSSVSRSYSFNLIPYYILKTSNNSMFQIGIGASLFRRRVMPIFSARFDFALTKKSFAGGEIKSFLIRSSEEFPFPILQVNYTVVL